ncbi:hypothetical protein R80B4_02267 [Fibrobacteres bacterium R8-0-B4]
MSKITLPETVEEWDAWEVEEARKDEEYIKRVIEKDPELRSSVAPRNSSKPFDLESFKETTKRLMGVLAEKYTC